MSDAYYGVLTPEQQAMLAGLATDAPPMLSAAEAAAARTRAPYAAAYDAAQQRPTRINTLAQAIPEGIEQTVKTPGMLMQPNPHPPGSEMWQWYENNKADTADSWSRDMAVNTLGTGAIVSEPGALGMAGGRLKVPQSTGAQLAEAAAPSGRLEVRPKEMATPNYDPPPGIGHNMPPSEPNFWEYNPSAETNRQNFIMPGDTRVSTRFPTAVNATEDPLRQHLSVGFQDMLKHSDPENLDHNMWLVSQYPGLKHLQGGTAEDIARGYVDQAKGNMRFVWDNAPKVMQQRSPLWYEGANRFSDALAQRYGIPRTSASGGIAVLSPQKDWFQNASLAERVGDLITGASKPWQSEMGAFAAKNKTLLKPDNADLVARVAGKRLDQLDDPLERAMWVRLWDEVNNPRAYRGITPEGGIGDFISTKGADKDRKIAWGSGGEIAKAIQMYESGGDADTISRLLGNKNKVRSFYNNIENPNDVRFGDVTADTHQVAAALLRPLSGNTPEVAHNFGSSLDKKHQPPGYRGTANSSVSGLQGTYPLQVEATQSLAKELGLLPRAMQSGVWEPVRELFTDKFKNNKKNIRDINDLWRSYDQQKISIDDVRRAILNRAGGIGEPSWARSGASVSDPTRASTYR